MIIMAVYARLLLNNALSIAKRFIKYDILRAERPNWNQHFSVAVAKVDSLAELRNVASNCQPLDSLILGVPNIEFLADPFLVRDGEDWHLFVEGFNKRKWRGEIGLFSSKDLVKWSDYQVVLSEPFHLSYPYVFRYEDCFYMVPESIKAEGIFLYRAKNFPYSWCRHSCLIEGTYSDASLVLHDNQWYCFCHHDKNIETHLYISDSLFGPWRRHTIGTRYTGDTIRSRPAGRPFIHEGQIVRPVQKTKPAYGESVSLLKTTILSQSDWVESDMPEQPLLGPSGTGWAAGGMHHMDLHWTDDGRIITTVDGWRLI